MPRRRVKRRRIGTGENGIVRRRSTRRNEVWGMDFVQVTGSLSSVHPL